MATLQALRELMRSPPELASASISVGDSAESVEAGQDGELLVTPLDRDGKATGMLPFTYDIRPAHPLLPRGA